MNSSTNFSLLFAISLLCISHTSSTNLYESLCKETKEGNLRCLKLLQPYPNITSAKDYLSLSKSILEMAIEKATKAESQVKELFKKYPSSPALKQCATIDYNGPISSFHSALLGIYEHPEIASYDAAVARDLAVLCRDNASTEKQLVKIQAFLSTLADDMIFLSEVSSMAINHLFPKDCSLCEKIT